MHLDLEIEKEKKENHENYISEHKLPTLQENSMGDLQQSQHVLSTIVPDSSVKEKNPYFIDKVKNFRNYYPENNCSEIIKSTHSMNITHRKLQIFSSTNYANKYSETEILKKQQKFKNYSFAVGKFTDLILQNLLRKSKIVIKKDEGGMLSPNSPNSTVRRKKKFSDFSGFFERTKGNTEESCKRIPDNITAKSSSSKKKIKFSSTSKSKSKIKSFK